MSISGVKPDEHVNHKHLQWMQEPLTISYDQCHNVREQQTLRQRLG